MLPLTDDKTSTWLPLLASYPPAEGHGSRARRRGKAVSLSLLHLSEGYSTATVLSKSRQDAFQLRWSRQTRVLSCHHPVPLPARKHAQNPPAWNCVDLGFPPGRLVQLLEAGSSEAFTWYGGGGGRQVQVLGFQYHIRAQGAGSKKQSPPAPTSTQLAKTTHPSKQRATISPVRWRVASWDWQSPLIPLWEVGIAVGMSLHRGKVAAWFLLWLHGLVLRAGICSKLGFLSCFFWFCFVLNDSISPLNLHL